MASLSGVDVLIVEDDPDGRELLELSLAGDGAAVRSASSFAEAREVLAEGTPDVLVTDLTLPDGDGISFVGALRADPATRDVPVVVLTGYADADSKRRASELDVQAFITKPIDVAALTAAIARAAASRGREHDARG